MSFAFQKLGPSHSLKMKWHWPSLEQMRKSVSSTWIVSLSLAQSDKPKITFKETSWICFKECQIFPRCDQPVHFLSGGTDRVGIFVMPCLLCWIFQISHGIYANSVGYFANSVGYFIYSQLPANHYHMVDMINVFLGGDIRRMSRPRVIFKTLPSFPKFSCPLLH